MKNLCLIGSLGLFTLLTACDFFYGPVHLKDSGRSYLKAQNGHQLVVPTGLSASKVGDAFQIPPVARTEPVPALPVPPDSVLNKGTISQPTQKKRYGWR